MIHAGSTGHRAYAALMMRRVEKAGIESQPTALNCQRDISWQRTDYFTQLTYAPVVSPRSEDTPLDRLIAT